MSAVADKLREAKALIERGWCRYGYSRGGLVCAMGAINQVCSGDPEGLGDQRAIEMLEKAIGETSIAAWNDRQPSKKPVLAAFDKAIELAESEQ